MELIGNIKEQDAVMPLGEVLADVVKALQTSAKGGSTEAVSALMDLHEHLRYTDLINGMDDDELTT